MKVCTHIGGSNAANTYVIYDGDFKCPFCALKEILKGFQDQQKVLYKWIKELQDENELLKDKMKMNY